MGTLKYTEYKILYYNIIMIILLILSLNLVSSEVKTLPSVKQGDCVNLPQLEKSSLYQTLISVQYPNKYINYISSNMTKIGDYYNYSFCNTTILGDYIVNGCSDLSCWNYDFLVTPNGSDMNMSEIVIYIFFLSICLLLIYLSYRLIINNPMKEDNIKQSDRYEMKKRDNFLFYMHLLKNKFWIVGVFGVYGFIIIFSVILNVVSNDLGLNSLTRFLFNLNNILLWGIIPFVLFWVGYIILYLWKSGEEILKYEMGVYKHER